MFLLHPGSPSLPDKAKHNREVMILLPSHRERANNAMYYNMAENGQVGMVFSVGFIVFQNKTSPHFKMSFFFLEQPHAACLTSASQPL